MTVVVQTPFNQHTGNGVTTLFGFTFQLLAAGDLEVSLDGVVQASGFTISGVGVQAGGSVTFAVAPANGVVVDIRRRIPLARSTDYQLNGDLPSDQIDLDFDRLVQMLQDAQFLSDLAVQLPVGDAAAPMTLPSVLARASRFLAFDASGNPIAASAVTGVPVTSFMETVLAAANATAARALLAAAKSGANSDITSLTALSTALSIAQGGTGQTTAAAAFAALKQAATDAASGVVELATNGESQAGTDTGRALTPANLAATMLGGVGQSWQDLTASRALGTTYTNTSGRPIVVQYQVTAGAGVQPTISISGVTVSVGGGLNGAGNSCSCQAIIPPGATYNATATSLTLNNWRELR